ncbi:hypothetical protein C8F04DRAFT_1127098 [Mycena alexandri]|uniref:Uncharacterized protein n=1 Tax=Mycena alexandri TaxID=1745969 RepID=A0AAD6SFG6_9AGAR|nr:hypothetical protein C8F04DRAFT_1127098 [Mycena alexandri]
MYVPPELVEVILRAVDLDVESLKACSLVGLAFQRPSQRMLLSSFTLDPLTRTTSYLAASSLLAESPHVASYVTSLAISLPLELLSSTDVESLIQIFSRLVNVQKCILDGGYLRFNSNFMDYIFRQSLDELHVISITNIPSSTFFPISSSRPRDLPLSGWYCARPRRNWPGAFISYGTIGSPYWDPCSVRGPGKHRNRIPSAGSTTFGHHSRLICQSLCEQYNFLHIRNPGAPHPPVSGRHEHWPLRPQPGPIFTCPQICGNDGTQQSRTMVPGYAQDPPHPGDGSNPGPVNYHTHPHHGV